MNREQLEKEKLDLENELLRIAQMIDAAKKTSRFEGKFLPGQTFDSLHQKQRELRDKLIDVNATLKNTPQGSIVNRAFIEAARMLIPEPLFDRILAAAVQICVDNAGKKASA
ncbi:MAG: hypothetical protein JO161_09460 [Planctomycetaceae bacterium]|nr:hypothetical protein [Planctomycetaceae bacterium]